MNTAFSSEGGFEINSSKLKGRVTWEKWAVRQITKQYVSCTLHDSWLDGRSS